MRVSEGKLERLTERGKKHKEQILLSALRRLRSKHTDGKQTFHLDGCQIPRIAFFLFPLLVPYGARVVSQSRASVTIWGFFPTFFCRLNGRRLQRESDELKACVLCFLALFDVVCLPFSRREILSNYKSKLPGEVLDRSTTRRKRERRGKKAKKKHNPVTTATHMWAPNNDFATHKRPAGEYTLPAAHARTEKKPRRQSVQGEEPVKFS